MTKTACAPAPPAAESALAEDDVFEEDGLIEEDLLLEDVSIDGMCGVY